MNLMLNCLILLLVINLPTLIDGQTSSCTSLRIEVETTSGNYEHVTGSTIYRPINATNLTMRCRCSDGNEIPHWALPGFLRPSPCKNQTDGVCFEKKSKWSQITFLTVKKVYEAYYVCFSGRVLDKFFKFLVYGPPVIKQPQYDSQVLLNSSSSITLQCRATGHGSLAYHWERKVLGKWILVNDNNMTSYMTRTSGQYRCNVTDSGSLSTVSPVFTIYVSKPTITMHPVNATLRALTSVTFTCSASDVNGVTYSWHRTNGDIPSTRSRGQNTNTLTITRAIPPDEGMYYCIATNDGGSTSSKSASLTVDDELSITVSPLNQTVSEGGVATFTATASGIKTREFGYEWFKFEGQESTLVEKNRFLIIDTIRVGDGGLYYSCIINEWNNTKCSLVVNLTISDSKDNDHAYNTSTTVPVLIILIILITSLVCCFGIDITLFILCKRKKESQNKANHTSNHTSNEEFKTSNPAVCNNTNNDTYLPNNLYYQATANQNTFIHHDYEVLHIKDTASNSACKESSYSVDNPFYHLEKTHNTSINHDYDVLDISTAVLNSASTHSVDNPLYQVKNTQDTYINPDYETSRSNNTMSNSTEVCNTATHSVDNPLYQDVESTQHAFINHDHIILNVDNAVSNSVWNTSNYSVDNSFYQVEKIQDTFINPDYEIININNTS